MELKFYCAVWQRYILVKQIHVLYVTCLKIFYIKIKIKQGKCWTVIETRIRNSSFFFFFNFYVGIQMISNAVIVLGGQHKGLSYTYSPIHYPHKLPSHPGCSITLSRVPCAIQQDLVGYPFLMQKCVHIHPKLHNHPFPPGNHKFEKLFLLSFSIFHSFIT